MWTEKIVSSPLIQSPLFSRPRSTVHVRTLVTPHYLIVVLKINLYENRAFQYTVQAICAPSFIQMAGEKVLIRFDLTNQIKYFSEAGGQIQIKSNMRQKILVFDSN